MLNHVMLIGRLTRDPEKAVTNAGHTVTTFTLAVDRPFKNGQGEREADFIRIVTWRKLGEVVAEYVQKGRLVAVEGRLQTRSYENNAGQRVYVTEVVAENVVFLDRPKTDSAPTSQNQQQPQMPPAQGYIHQPAAHVPQQPVYQMAQAGRGQPDYSASRATAYSTHQTPAYNDADLPF